MKKNLLATIGCCAGALVALVTLYFLLTVAQGAIPNELTKANMEKSLATMDQEGVYVNFGALIGRPSFTGFAKDNGDGGNSVDNFTNMWMMQTADSAHFFDEEEYVAGKPYDASRRKPIEGGFITQAFRATEGDGNYWNGYRIYLKPLLMVTDIWGIRLLQILFVVISVAWAARAVAKRIGGIPSLLMLLSILAINPLNTIMGLAQAPDLIQAMLSVVTVLWMLERGVSKRTLAVYFLFLGSFEIFINCLIMPLVTLGMPLAACLMWMHVRSRDMKERLQTIVCTCLAWGIGYAVTFMSVWMISAVLKGGTPLDGISRGLWFFFWRAGSEETSWFRSVFSAIQNNVSMNVPVVWLLIIACAYLIAIRWRAQGRTTVTWTAPLLVVASFPFIWMIVLNNHSTIHAWMAHDILMVTVWCLSYVIYELIASERVGTGNALPSKALHMR